MTVTLNRGLPMVAVKVVPPEAVILPCTMSHPVGLRSLTVTLDLPRTEEEKQQRLTGLGYRPKERPPRPHTYTLRLHFVEPDDLKPGQRLFDVAVQGQVVLSGLDIVRETGGPNVPLVREFAGIKVEKDLTVTFTPADGARSSAPLLSGLEIVAED